MRNIKIKHQPAAVIVPFGLSVVAVCINAVWAIMAAAVSVFLIIGFTPLLRKRANLWTFLFVGIAGIPVNLPAAYRLTILITAEGHFLRSFLYAVVFFFMLFSVEELLFGMAARLLFPNQTK